MVEMGGGACCRGCRGGPNNTHEPIQVGIATAKVVVEKPKVQKIDRTTEANKKKVEQYQAEDNTWTNETKARQRELNGSCMKSWIGRPKEEDTGFCMQHTRKILIGCCMA